MSRTDTRLRAASADLREVVSTMPVPEPASVPRRSRSHRIALAGATAVAAIAAAGALALIWGLPEREVADPPPTSIAVPSTTTVPDPTTTVGEPVPTTVPAPAAVPGPPLGEIGEWTRLPTSSAPSAFAPFDAIATDRGWVAVGQSTGTESSAAWWSEDGLTWTTGEVPGDMGTEMSGVVRFGEGFVAVGGAPSTAGRSMAAVWRSPDGLTWERVASDAPDPGAARMRDVASFGEGLVAGGYSCAEEDPCPGAPTIWTSPDGVSWERTTLGDGGAAGGVESIVSIGGRLIAVGAVDPPSMGEPSVTRAGEDVAAWLSDDGSAWTSVGSAAFGGEGNQWVESAAAGPAGVVAVGADWAEGRGALAAIWWSADGTEWIRASIDDPGGSGAAYAHDVVVLSDGYLVVGSDGEAGAAWTSADGIVWSRTAAPWGEALMASAAASADVVTAIRFGSDGTGAWVTPTPDILAEPSTSAGSWSRFEDALEDAGWILDLTADDRGLLARGFVGPEGCADPSCGRAAAWRSADGTSWTEVDAAGEDPAYGSRSVAAGGGRMVEIDQRALSEDEYEITVRISENGDDWADVTGDAFEGAHHLAGVVWDGSRFLIGGISREEAGLKEVGVWTSPDGLAWARIEVPAPPDTEIHDLEMIAATSRGVVLATGLFDPIVWVSADGEAWNASVLDLPGGEFVPGAAVDLGDRLALVGVHRGAGVVMALQVWVSPDGVEWIQATGGDGLFRAEWALTRAAVLDGRLVILDETGTIVWVWDPAG